MFLNYFIWSLFHIAVKNMETFFFKKTFLNILKYWRIEHGQPTYADARVSYTHLAVRASVACERTRGGERERERKRDRKRGVIVFVFLSMSTDDALIHRAYA